MNNLLKMDAQNTYDTITVMGSYNFHQPINTSILYEDHEKEPNKMIDLQDNRLNSVNLQIDRQSLDLSVQQENVYTVRKEPITKLEVNHHRKLYGVGISKHNSKIRQKYTVCKNFATGNLVNRNPYPNGKNVHINNNSREIRSQINESVLFDEVAKNLSLILKAYVHYGKLICRCDDTQYAARIRAKYLRVKYFYFDKSLPIAEEFLLQRENNKQFIKSLLLKVVEFSKFSPHEMPYEYLIELYNGLLKWTKIKTYKLTSNVHKNLTTTGNSPAEILLPNIDFKSENGDQNLFTRNILSRGQPGSQIMISVDPKILAQYRNTFNGQNQSAYSTEINDPAQSFAKTNSPNMEMERNVTHQISHTNFSTIDDINRQNLQSADPRVPFYSGSMYFTENDKCMLNNGTQNSSYNVMFTEGKQMNLEDTTRSSISRDSGFTSPVTLGSPLELEYNSFQHQSSQYGIDTSALQMPSTTTTTIEPNFAQEFSYAWKSIVP